MSSRRNGLAEIAGTATLAAAERLGLLATVRTQERVERRLRAVALILEASYEAMWTETVRLATVSPASLEIAAEQVVADAVCEHAEQNGGPPLRWRFRLYGRPVKVFIVGDRLVLAPYDSGRAT